MFKNKIKVAWKIPLVFFIILAILIISVGTSNIYLIPLIGIAIGCLILAILFINRRRTKKATVTLIKKEGDDGITRYGISINGSKPLEDEWFIADGHVTIQDVVYDKSGISYRIFIHEDGQLIRVKRQRHKLKDA